MELLAVILFGILVVVILWAIEDRRQRRRLNQFIDSLPTMKEIRDDFDKVYAEFGWQFSDKEPPSRGFYRVLI